MRLVAERDQLVSTLAPLARLASRQGGPTATSGVRFDVTDTKVTATATDLELAVSRTVTAEPAENGTAIIPGKLLFDVVKALPPGRVTIEADTATEWVAVTAGAAAFELHLFPEDQWPKLPTVEGTVVTVSSVEFLEGLEHVGFSASKDQNRPLLGAISVEATGDALLFAATDSYRLAALSVPSLPGIPSRVLLPAETVHLAAQAGFADTVNVTFGDRRILIEDDEISVHSALIEGDYPNWKNLVPNLPTWGQVTLPVEETIATLKRLRVLVAGSATPVRFTLRPGEEVAVDAAAVDVGSGSETIPDSKWDAEPLEVSFSPNYLLEGLAAVGTETARLNINDNLKPALLVSDDPDSTFQYVVMPVRVT